MRDLNWNIAGYNRDTAVEILRSGINPLVSVILASRGISSAGEAQELLRDDGLFEDPLVLKDMSTATERIRKAIENNEICAVYGDYDVDGITSSCLVADYLRNRGLLCHIYIPERLESGYGVNSKALYELADKGVTLIITVDCGVTACEEAVLAKELGIDLVITDHHECSGELPPAIAVVDPKRPDCPSVSKSLAGVGVAFKLICAVEGTEHTDRLLKKYGDLVAVGTIADVMPVTGENRAFIKKGLEILKTDCRAGFKELFSAAGLMKSKITVSAIGYSIAPRINASGRLGKTDTAVDLLMTEDSDKAALLAKKLCDLNRERQTIEGAMFQEAVKLLEGREDPSAPIVLSKEEWHQGVAGIVASRLADKYSVPAVMICLKDGIGRGSCRSSGGFNLYAALEACGEHLITFGGHELAAGLTVSEDKIADFRAAFSEFYKNNPPSEDSALLNVDFEVIKPSLLSVENVEAMSVLEPYGAGNPQPVLCLKNVKVESVVPLSEGKHTKLWLSKNGTLLEAVFFSRSPQSIGAKAGQTASAAFTPQINEFRGRRSVQLLLSDFIPC